MSNVQNTHPGWWEKYAVPVLAAGAAMAPGFPLYKAKSSLQLGRGLPPVHDLFKGVAEAVPMTGVVVGSQLLAKKMVKEYSGLDPKDPSTEAVASLAVATASSPFLIALNGLSMNHSIWQSLRSMDRRQIGTTAVRELFFLGAVSDDENRDYPTTFAVASSLNLVASPADNYLTRLMAKEPTIRWQDYAKGAPMRALFSGTFAICYKFFSEKLREMHD